RLRLLEAITLTLERGAAPGASPAGPVVLSHEDPLLLELRQEIIDACRPDVLLARSADVLLALISSVHRGEYLGFAADALVVLARVGVPAIPPLLSRLVDKRWFVVRNALYTLRKIGHASAFPAIVAVLEHPDPRVRLEAVRVAIQVDRGAARAPVLRRVHDPD